MVHLSISSHRSSSFQVDEKTRLAMYKLRQTWTPYFSNLTLHNLDTRTHYIDPAWPITARQPDPSATTNHIHPNAMNKSDDSDRSATKSTSSRDDNYNMIPIDRARSTLEHINEKNSDHDPPVKASVINEKRDPRQAANLIDSALPENSNSNKTKAPTLNDTPDPPVSVMKTPCQFEFDSFVSLEIHCLVEMILIIEIQEV